MRIPVFVSCPTSLSPAQEASRDIIGGLLEEMNLEPRALGRSDYPVALPLREVFVIARHCAGGIILGFSQFIAKTGVMKPGTTKQIDAADVQYPTAWNHLEAGILYSLGFPLLVFREPGITGGVFDPGVSDVFVNDMPVPGQTRIGDLREMFLKWRGKVSEIYYADTPVSRK
jgi:hypothetical protein